MLLSRRRGRRWGLRNGPDADLNCHRACRAKRDRAKRRDGVHVEQHGRRCQNRRPHCGQGRALRRSGQAARSDVRSERCPQPAVFHEPLREAGRAPRETVERDEDEHRRREARDEQASGPETHAPQPTVASAKLNDVRAIDVPVMTATTTLPPRP